MSIDAHAAARRVVRKCQRYGVARVVFVSYDGRVLSVAKDCASGGYVVPAHRVVGVFDGRATLEGVLDAIEATVADLSRRGLEKHR